MFFLCNQKTAYGMRISDCSSDVCSSDLVRNRTHAPVGQPHPQVLKQILGTVARAANIEEAHDAVAVGKQRAFDALGGLGSIMRIGHGLLALARPLPSISAASSCAIRSAERSVGQECDSTGR